jgi:tetratricopeptide (TPR) repeat protein
MLAFHWFPSLVRRAALGLLCAVLLPGCPGGRDDAAVPPDSGAVARPEPSKLQTAIALHQQGDSDKALELVQQVLIAEPENLEALRLAIGVHDRLGRFCDAAELAVRIAEAEPPQAGAVLIRAFDWHLRCGDFETAEKDLRRAAELAPANPEVHRLLAKLLNSQGRRFEASEQVIELIRLRVIQPNEILSLVDLRGPFQLVSFDEFVDESELTLFSLGRARYQYTASRADPEAALELVRRIVQRYPDSTAAHAFLGRMLAETAQLDELRQWFGNLPAGIDEQPEYWYAIGRWMAQQDRHPEAIGALVEALRRDPGDRESLRSMIASLVLIGEETLALGLRDRLAELDRIFRIAKDADAEQALWISQTLQAHTRPWESSAWLMYSARLSGRLGEMIPDLNKRHATIVAWEQGATVAQVRQARLQRLLGFPSDRWPLPDLEAADRAALPAESLAGLSTGLRFDDVAGQAGIRVPYHSGFPLDGSAMSPYQTNGGGLAVLDYDLDGRGDVYVVQSGGKPNDPLGSTANQLFRLLPEARFAEVTEASACGDRSYGQGACAGDVNQDGFPDLLVANIGANVLYLNQGDGTFRLASQLISENPDRWTSSLGLSDLDGDHLPEIIEINYIDDPRAFVVRCQQNYLDCQPQEFRKAADRLHRCRADGTFVPWEAGWQTSVTPKLGFGLIIANFDRQHGNDVFISNDGDLNHYWVSTAMAAPGSGPYTLTESATLHGCSVGRGGNSQACMGIAAGDFNRDGTLDLHVTNFLNEPVNLFLQSQSGIFVDEALKYRLVTPSFGVLGFGTQSADFDHDGWLDLAVLNGHVFDGRFEGLPFQMLPQLLRGSRDGFALADQAEAGQYWQTKRLGRTLAMLDWNRDGRVDLLANHLDEPLALLQNESPAAGWLQLELVGTRSERDAIGAEVRVQIGDQSWTSWQFGGDGLMSSNEAVVHFGLGAAASVDRIEVRWPSGLAQTFEDVPASARYLVIEGDESLHRRWP